MKMFSGDIYPFYTNRLIDFSALYIVGKKQMNYKNKEYKPSIRTKHHNVTEGLTVTRLESKKKKNFAKIWNTSYYSEDEGIQHKKRS